MTLFPGSSRFPFRLRTAALAAACCCVSVSVLAQAPTPDTGLSAPPSTAQTNQPVTTQTTTTAQDGSGKQSTVTTTRTSIFSRGKKKDSTPKDSKVQQTKDTKKAIKKEQKAELAAGMDANLPDKALYDKAVKAMNKGHYDVARLDLQTMLNTYPDSQYQMRAKLAIADSWYKEGGTAALTQAESEYADFRVFFPNAPEAAEAQMRIGDIYFRQMDKPDRDYSKATHAEEEYRRMMTDYPNADPKLTTQARQRLRDVQEVLAFRESDIGTFYASHENWAAAIARYQTVVDTYPLYSHMDDTLIGLGDAYAAEARYIRTMKLPEAGKAKLEKLYDGKAEAAYREVVLNHAAAPHVEDARDRLAAMNVPIPVPTKDQLAASEALENSRRQYTISDRAVLLFMHSPDVVSAARLGEPSLTDPKPVLAPAVTKSITGSFKDAFNVADAPAAPAAAGVPAAEAAPAAAATPAAPAAPLALQEVGTEASDAAGATKLTAAPTAAITSGGVSAGGNTMGVEILSSGSSASTGTAAPRGTMPTDGLTPVGPADTTPLPPVEAGADAPSTGNEINAAVPAAQAPRPDGKRTKPAFDKSEESSSKHPKKKGIKKVNPF